MNVDAVHRLSLWWETADGDRLPANLENADDMPPVETHPFACVRFPLVIQTVTYRRRPDGGYGGDDRLFTCEASANAALVLALATTGGFSLHDALIIASEACGRCLNALAYQHFLGWGYPEGGPEWLAAKTECEMCR